MSRIDRRQLLTAAPVGIAAVVAGAAPVEAMEETPVAALFREWSALNDRIENGDDLSDDALDEICEHRGDIAFEIYKTKVETVSDALMKVCAMTVFGVYGEADVGLVDVWTEARALVGA